MTGKPHISESAFLVNESRARNVGLSRDRYAGLWVTDATRRLWEDFSREVYPYDDTELALRNRFYLEVLEASIRKDPAVVFVNLAAGFTSYPFLTEKPCRSIEVDFDHVCRFKKSKIEKWRRRSAVPLRDVEYLACDLANEHALGALSARLRGELGSARSVVFLEGITYYLERTALLRLFGILGGLQRPGSVIALDFWTPDADNHPVHARFRKFFAERFGHGESEYNVFDADLLRTIDGYEIVELTDIVELERRFSNERKLTAPQEILPERYAVLERRERNQNMSSEARETPATVFKVANLVQWQKDSVVSRTLIKREKGTVTLFAFDKENALSEHTAPFDALLHVLDGEAEIKIDNAPYQLKAGEAIILPANHAHAVRAVTPFKMILTMIRS